MVHTDVDFLNIATEKVHSVEPYGYDFGLGYYPLGGIDFGYGPFLPRPVKTIHSETTVHRPGYSFTSTNTEILSRDKDTKAEEAKADAQVDAKAEAQVDAKVEAQVDAKVETQVGANEDEGDQLILVSWGSRPHTHTHRTDGRRWMAATG